MFQSNQSSCKLNTGIRVRPNKEDEKKHFPVITPPKSMGFFSIVDGVMRNYEPSAAQLRYYKPPKNFPLDLNRGINQAIKKPEAANDEKLDKMLKFIFDEREKLFKHRNELCAEFVCWRGLLRLLMCTPYEYRQDWCIHVMRYRGTFYLCKRDTDHEKRRRAEESANQKKMAAWGFKFEQYCLAETPFSEPCSSEPVDECSEFSCVFKTTIGGLDILYGAEMDGIISEQPVTLLNSANMPSLRFIELKLRQNNLNSRQWQTYKKHKTCQWWCQSFLVGIQDIFVGLRSENGMLEKIDQTSVRSLPRQADNYWHPTVCLSFLIQFLTFLKSLMANIDCPRTVYEFYFNSETSRVNYECFKGTSEHSFLPDWYLELLQRQAAYTINLQ